MAHGAMTSLTAIPCRESESGCSCLVKVKWRSRGRRPRLKTPPNFLQCVWFMVLVLISLFTSAPTQAQPQTIRTQFNPFTNPNASFSTPTNGNGNANGNENGNGARNPFGPIRQPPGAVSATSTATPANARNPFGGFTTESFTSSRPQSFNPNQNPSLNPGSNFNFDAFRPDGGFGPGPGGALPTNNLLYNYYSRQRNYDEYSNSSAVQYMIIAPEIIQPDSIFRVVIATYKNATTEIDALDVRLSILKDGADIQGNSMIMTVGETESLILQIPMKLTLGDYRLRLEGNYLGSQGGSIFVRESPLRFSAKFLSILIQTNRYIYTGGQKVIFRVILLRRDLRAYGNPVDIYIRDARDIVMRRFPSVPTKMGVIDLTYELPEFTNLGKWRIQVVAGPQVEEKVIVIEKYFPALYEVTVSMPPYLLAKDETITATVSAFYGTEKAVNGPARVSLLVKQIPVYPTGYYPQPPFPGRQGLDRDHEYAQDHVSTADTLQDQIRQGGWTTVQTDEYYLKSSQDMVWSMYDIRSFLDLSKSYMVRVEAEVTDFFIGEPRYGFAESRIISESLQLKFVSPSPLVFKPGLPFETYIQVSYTDHEKIPSDTLRASHLRILPEVYAEAVPGSNAGARGQFQLPIIQVLPENGANDRDIYGNEIPTDREEPPEGEEEEFSFRDYYEKAKLESYWKTGLFLIRIPKVPKEATRMRFRAEYSDAEGNVLSAEETATTFYSPGRKFISVRSTAEGLSLGVSEYAVMQFKANFFIEKFHYVVLGKGLLLQYGTESLPNAWSVSKSFAIPISSEMAPGFRVCVFSFSTRGELLTDSIFLPVERISKHSISMRLNQNKDRSKDTVELAFFGEPGAYFGISAQRSMRYYMHAGNELSKASVLRTFYELEPSNGRISHAFWRSRSGEYPEEVQYLPTSSSALDATRTFTSSHILVFADGDREIPLHSLREDCESYENCTNDCFSYIDHCGRLQACQNQNFQSLISRRPELLECDPTELDLIDYRADRDNHIIDFYDPDVGDWAWTSQNLPHGGDYYLVLDVPKVTDTWHVNGFAVGVLHGFAIIDEPIEYESNRPFLMTVDAPPAIRRGEQMGIITNLFNKTPKDIFITVTLHGSDDYEFVHAGHDGLNIFDAGEVRFSGGDHQYFLWIPTNGEVEFRIPVRPTVDQGTISVMITATAQVRSHTETIDIDVLAEGIQIGKHTSMVLDLKNRAFVLKYLNIFPEVTPEQPYEEIRKYIIGSKAGHVMVYGDVMGPIFPELPVNMEVLIGKPGKGTADRVFDLAVNVWSVHYLRLTNQLDSPTAKQVFVQLNKIFAQVMKRFRPGGYFKMWNLSKPSVWLSAWAIRIFAHGSFQDWENYFYVEQEVFTNVTKWILGHQNFDGTFSETYWYAYPLNKRMGDGRNLELSLNGPFNVSLTAHVAITLHQVVPILDGGLKVDANIAKSRAIQYLERILVDLTDPYQVALVTYALTLSDSTEKDAAYSKLQTLKIQDAGFMYWSGGEVPTNFIIYENQRPFTEPKNNEYWDSYAVEATSYALLVYLMRDGVTPMTEQIVSWINTMKLTDGSFISSVDTSVAFQALTEYANRARLRDVTDLTVTLEFSSDATVHEIKINSDNIKEVHTFDISEVWGHVNVIARGSGQAVVQLDLSYGIERDEFKDVPPHDCFDLEITEYYSLEQNKSSLTIQSCFRWTYLEESPVSGAAVLEVEIPSGYGIVHSDALSLIAAGIHPTLKDTVVGPGKTSWYFDSIPAEWSCFNHTVRRWHPVANVTVYKQATLYEAYALERFVNTIYSDYSLRDLTICQVCGSFQCPYCPFFNRSQRLQAPGFFSIGGGNSLLVLLLISYYYNYFVSPSSSLSVFYGPLFQVQDVRT